LLHLLFKQHLHGLSVLEQLSHLSFQVGTLRCVLDCMFEGNFLKRVHDDAHHDVGDDKHRYQQPPLEGHLKEHSLSLREIEVAELLVKGNRISAIASRLYISENTVRGHAKNIYRKLGVHNRQELIDLGDRLSRA